MEIYVAARDAGILEVLLPPIDDARDGSDLLHRCVLFEREHARHRKSIGEGRIGFVFADPHLLKAERLTGRKNVVGGRKLILLCVRHQQRMVLLVIVGVVDEDVEHHPAKQLAHVRDVAVARGYATASKQLREFRVAEPFGGSSQRDMS